MFDTHFFPSAVGDDGKPPVCSDCGKRQLNKKRRDFHQRFVHPTPQQKANQRGYGLNPLPVHVLPDPNIDASDDSSESNDTSNEFAYTPALPSHSPELQSEDSITTRLRLNGRRGLNWVPAEGQVVYIHHPPNCSCGNPSTCKCEAWFKGTVMKKREGYYAVSFKIGTADVNWEPRSTSWRQASDMMKF